MSLRHGLATLLALLLPAAQGAAAPWPAVTVAHSASFEMHSAHTGQRYRIQLGLPRTPPPADGYPVLWALDGNASFPLLTAARPALPKDGDSAAWRARQGEVHDGLIVAVGYRGDAPFDVDARALDYTPTAACAPCDAFSPRHGGADAFRAFLLTELRPLLAQRYRLDPARHTLFGFSYGGLFTLDTLSRAPQAFQRYWAASPSLWFGEHYLLQQLPARLAGLPPAPLRLTVSVGLDEQFAAADADPALRRKLAERRMVDNSSAFVAALRQARPDWPLQLLQLPAHDHFDMLQHGARRVLAFAFAP